MQSTTLQFEQLAKGYVRPLVWSLRASFLKEFNAATTFFTLDTSTLDGIDVLAPTSDNPIAEWDKYTYQNLDDRVISLEVVREQTQPYSITQAYADIALNNYDNYFTPNSGSPIEDYILPRRPFRLSMGFGNETVPQIVGLSEKMPSINKSSRSASFHVIDFMSYILTRDVGGTIMLQDVKTHEVLAYLLDYMGLDESQYALDGSLNTIKFFYVEAGTTFGTVLSKLIEAEIGLFYLDEQGVLRFKNRYNYDLTPVYTFDESNTIDYSVSEEDSIINSVKIVGSVREVQASKSVGTGQNTQINSGESVDVFVNFNDPVTSVTNPVYSATQIASSYFTTNLDEDGTGVYTGVTLTSLTLFSKSAKLTFNNSGASDAFITALDVYGTPAEVVEAVNVSKVDQDSIDNYDEHTYSIDNEYIQSKNDADTRAISLLNDYSEYGSTVELDVKGNPAIQLGDAVTLDLDGYQGTYSIIKTTNIINGGKFSQRIRALKRTVGSFFILDVSELNNVDLLSP